MNERIIAEATAWLKRSSQLPAPARDALAAVVPTLIAALPQTGPLLIGVGGPPGTGKSTLARLLSAVLTQSGRPAGFLSLDNYYLPRAARAAHAATTHPLFARRGVPGTHDLDLLLHDVNSLLTDSVSELRLPFFDKATDDRAPQALRWQNPVPDVLFLEGWCVGCPPEHGLSQAQPVNSFERREDPNGRWWAMVCENVAEYEKRLHCRLDQRWLMLPPSWPAVVRWRWEQEQELGARMHLISRHDVRTFLAPFERLGMFILDTGERWADLIVRLDDDHRPLAQTATLKFSRDSS